MYIPNPFQIVTDFLQFIVKCIALVIIILILYAIMCLVFIVGIKIFNIILDPGIVWL
jgi:hypothetical protein